MAGNFDQVYYLGGLWKDNRSLWHLEMREPILMCMLYMSCVIKYHPGQKVIGQRPHNRPFEFRIVTKAPWRAGTRTSADLTSEKLHIGAKADVFTSAAARLGKVAPWRRKGATKRVTRWRTRRNLSNTESNLCVSAASRSLIRGENRSALTSKGQTYLSIICFLAVISKRCTAPREPAIASTRAVQSTENTDFWCGPKSAF